MVDLEDVKPRPGIAIGEGIESGAEQDVLLDSIGDGAGEIIFGVAAAGDEMGAHGDREWPFAWGTAEFLGVGWTEDRDGDRVREDQGLVVKLVSGATQSDAERGAGWECLLHSLMVAEVWSRRRVKA